MPWIFEIPDALNEKTDDVALSGQQLSEVKSFEDRIVNWSKGDDNKIVAFSGRFGTGKSAVLKRVEHEIVSKGACLWLTFEAWRYPDREKLWQGFVIEVISRIKNRDDLSRAAQEIDGVSGVYGFISRHIQLSAALTLALGTLVASTLWLTLRENTDTVSKLVIALLKYAMPALLAISAFLGISSLFQRKEPLKHLFELENELEEVLSKKLEKPLIIVVEDVDRAGEEGIVFMETLRFFIDKRLGSYNRINPNPIMIISPQDSSYMSSHNRTIFERNIKIYDLAIHYSHNVVRSSAEIDALLEDAALEEKYLNEIRAAIGLLPLKTGSQIPFRLLKYLLRELHEYAGYENDIDAGLALILISFRYSLLDENKSLLDVLRQRMREASVIPFQVSNHVGEASSIFRIITRYYSETNDTKQGFDKISNFVVDFSCKKEIDISILETHPVGSCDVKISFNNRYLKIVE